MATNGEKPRRDRDTGSVYQRKDGRWVATVPLGMRAGKRLRKSYYFASEGQARAKLKNALKEPDRVENQDDKIRTDAYLRRWLVEVAKPTIRPSTFARYEQIASRQIIPQLGAVKLSKLSPADVQAMLNRLAREPRGKGRDGKPLPPLSARSIHHVRAVLRRALATAVRWEMIPRNPATMVDPPRVERPELAVLSVDDARRLLEACPKDAPLDPSELRSVGAAERLGALYVLALSTGMRQGELLALRWQDVDLKAGRLNVRHALQRIDSKLTLVEPKTRQSRRTITLAPVAVAALTAHRARQKAERLIAGRAWKGPDRPDDPTGWVFATTIGTPLPGPRVTVLWQRFAQAHNLPAIRFHSLRHSAASLLMAAGTHPRVVADLLGHSTTRLTLDTYSHVAESLRREVADRMQTLLGEQAPPIERGR